MSMFPIITQKCLKTSKNYESRSDVSDRRENLFKIENFLNNDNSNNNSNNLRNDNNNDRILDDLSNNKNIGVFAAENIKNNTISCGVSSVNLINKSIIQKYEISLNSTDGFLRPIIFKNDLSWMKCIKLSKDIHSHNAVIELNRNELIRIRIVKDIENGEEIIAWFSEEISMLMSIPFLTPTNIRGNNCYKCHNCNKSFEYPNPLKIHLATLCGQQSKEILWIKLHYTLVKTSTVTEQNNHQQNELQQSLSSTQETIKSFNQISLFPNDILIRSTLATSFDRHHRQSAFKPIIPPIRQPLQHQHYLQHTSQSNRNSNPQSEHRISPVPSHHQIASSSVAQTASAAEVAALNAAAQIETIVSNMGASKQGHLCIYCGKIYSRKYGLKIHIRTHTGFKPLKCKFCLRPFGDPSNLNKHVRLHLQTGNLTYRCHLCHKTLARRRDLQRHIETKHCLSELQKRNLC